MELNQKQTKQLGCLVLIIIPILITFVSIATKEKDSNSQLVEKYFSSWDGSSEMVVEAVKTKLVDSSSFEHIKTQHFTNENYDYFIVKMTYASQNRTGATIKNTALAHLYFDGKVKILELE